MFENEINLHGSLAKLLRAKITDHTILDIVGFDELFNGSKYWAKVSNRNRSSELCISKDGTTCILPLCENGVHLGSLSTTSLFELIKIIEIWFLSEAKITDLAKTYNTIKVYEIANFYELGSDDFIKQCWIMFEKWIETEYPWLMDILKLAKEKDEFIRLIPNSSHGRLFFEENPFDKLHNEYPFIESKLEGHIDYAIVNCNGKVLFQGNGNEVIEAYLSYKNAK